MVTAQTTPNASAPSRNGRGQPAAPSAAQLVMLTDPRSPAAEAYRTLRINVQFANVDHDTRLVAVTSAGAGEGKSTTVANLAIAIAEGGDRVIVVDADLRRPSLHQAFGLPNREGLSSAMLADDGRLALQDTQVAGLRLLTSGPLPPNPLELLGSKRLDRVLDALRREADVVLFDTPPAAGLADAPILASRVDGVILVVGAGRTRRDLAKQSKEHLERVNARILGVVLTGVRPDNAIYGY